MTSDMAFECVLVSQDPGVLAIMNRLLDELAITTSVCPTSVRAFDRLSEGETDLVIIDWQKDSDALLQHIERSRGAKKPTVVIVSEVVSSVPETYSLVRKPVTVDSGARSLQVAYSKMLRDYRRHFRYATMFSLAARNQYGRSLQVSIVNIGEGGIGLNTQEFIDKADVLSFSVLLPGTDMPIDIHARVLWTRQYGAVGCEFAHISPSDRRQLQDWLEQKCVIRKPTGEHWGYRCSMA